MPVKDILTYTYLTGILKKSTNVGTPGLDRQFPVHTAVKGTGLCGQNMFETLKGEPSNVASFFFFFWFCFCEEIALLFIRRRF